jgi:hypothetical protein
MVANNYEKVASGQKYSNYLLPLARENGSVLINKSRSSLYVPLKKNLKLELK